MEPLLQKEAIEFLANLSFKVVSRGGTKILQWIKGDMQTIKQAYHIGSGKYIRKYQERYGQLKVLGMREPVDLHSVYTDVKILSEVGVRRYLSAEEMEEAFRESGKRGFQSAFSLKRDGIEVANSHQFMMVLGGPGVGKSTFLRRVGFECLLGKNKSYKHEVIPVFIELKRVSSSNFDIGETIAEEFEICGFPNPDDLVAEALRQGKMLILFDGLDEVPSEYLDHTIFAIQDFVDRYGKNRFIASCRVAAYKGGFYRFTDVEMADFDDGQIKAFIYKWFGQGIDADLDTADRCWETLNKYDYIAAKELAHTPILLTLLCLVYHYSQDFPKNRSILYREALDVLLRAYPESMTGATAR